MNTQGSKVKVYRSVALIASVFGFALYLLCYLLAGDGTDYFIASHPIPKLANALACAFVLWSASSLVLIPKDVLPTENFMQGKPCFAAVFPIIGTLSAGAVGMSYYGKDELSALLDGQVKLDTTAICAILVMLGVLLSIAYYLLRVINRAGTASASIFTGLGPVALLTGLCGLTYFESDHHMNAPAKIAMQLAFIATMIFLTAELRYTIDRAQPRRYLASASVALFANVCALPGAFPVLLDFQNAVHGTRILGLALLCLCNGVYIAYRLLSFSRYCTLPAVPEQTQGKEQDDGCQQQDSMASQENN